MARPNEYTRKRFFAMQAGMWVLLLAAMGVAALVNHVRRGEVGKVRLADPIQLRTVTVRLPAHWQTEISDANEGAVLAHCRDRSFRSGVRALSVIELDPTPLGLRFFEGLMKSAANAKQVKIDFGDAQGSLDIPQASGAFQAAPLSARGVLPSGREVRIFVQRMGPEGADDDLVSDDDITLVKQVAATVKALGPGEIGPQLKGR